MANPEATDASYTVFIRLPFPREGFADPPPVDWDAVKDKALWKILSNTSKNANTDWSLLAEKFDVSLPFILQQAAWLYERQLSQVRAQMRRVGASKTSAQSPLLGTESTGGETMRRTGSSGGGPGGEAMKRTGSGGGGPGGELMRRTGSGGGSGGGETMRRAGSGGGGSRVPSSSSPRMDSPAARADVSIPTASSRGNAPPLSRTSSANTVKGRVHPRISPRPAKASLHHLSKSPPSNIRTNPPNLVSSAVPTSNTKDASSSEAAKSSSSDSSSDSEPAQSRLLRRPPRFSTHRLSRAEDAEDGDDDAPAFVPFPAAIGASNMQTDPSATLRGDLRSNNRRNPARKSMEVAQKSQTSDSSNSSTAPLANTNPRSHNNPQRPPGPLSPRRTAELAGRNATGKGKIAGREGSDGTPSMGSSFSDLDDASVTQSALEEALASNMKQGGMASRMSTISQALRSRYL